mmetsp:Transcript_36346/g.87180  ORF Transcript_36346/g.87180 Transcript_36346/m.87180 type:complete len:209 (+) Transcript_36346:211-837(+)
MASLSPSKAALARRRLSKCYAVGSARRCSPPPCARGSGSASSMSRPPPASGTSRSRTVPSSPRRRPARCATRCASSRRPRCATAHTQARGKQATGTSSAPSCCASRTRLLRRTAPGGAWQRIAAARCCACGKMAGVTCTRTCSPCRAPSGACEATACRTPRSAATSPPRWCCCPQASASPPQSRRARARCVSGSHWACRPHPLRFGRQ